MAPVIFKVKFYSNSKSKTINQNIAHITYIATRPGVDKSEDVSNELDEEFIDLDNAESHAKYMAERPRSHGLFDDKDRVIDLSDIKNELREHKGIVWRSVLSLKEEDAVKLGYINREQWQETLRSYIPEAAKVMGIEETNLRWVAAFHQEQGHPHCHIMFWEKDPKRTRGKLGEWEINNMKKAFIKGLYEKERSHLYAEKTAKRDLIRDLAKDDLAKAVDLIRETRKEDLDVKVLEGNKNGIVQKLWTDKEKELSRRIVGLSKIMPDRGRIALKYMPEDVKEEVKEISDWILKQPGFNSNLDVIKRDAVELANQYTDDIKSLQKAQDKAYTDIRNRVSQVVLKAAVESKLESNAFIDKDKADIAVKYLKDANKIDLKEEKRELLKSIGSEINKINHVFNENIEIKRSLDLVNQKLNINLNDIEIDNVVKDILSKPVQVDETKTDDMLTSIKIISNSGDNEILNKFIIKKIKDIRSTTDKYLKDNFDIKDNLYRVKNYDALKEDLKFTPNKLEKSIIKKVIDKDEFELKDLIKETEIAKNIPKKTEKFKFSKYDANVIFKQFDKTNTLNNEKLKNRVFKYNKSEEKAEYEYSLISKRIDKLVKNGYIDKKENYFKITEKGFQGVETINKQFQFTSYDSNVVCNYINKAGGELTKNKLKHMIQEQYKDEKYIEKQFSYLIKRLDNNVKSGYMSVDKGYKLTDKGLDALKNQNNKVVIPIKNKLNYLKKLDLISENNGVYRVNNKSELKKILYSKQKKNSITNKINDRISENNGYITEREITKIYDEVKKDIRLKFKDIEINYEKVRSQFKIKDTEKETVKSMGKVLFNVGMTKQEVNNFIKDFKTKADLKINNEELEKIVDKSYKQYEESNKWNRYERMSNNKWNKLFKNLGYKEDDIPKNMYLNSYEKKDYSNINALNIAGKAWKGAWRALEKEKYREDIKAQKIRRQLNRNKDYYEQREGRE